jgi:hypothetical protein
MATTLHKAPIVPDDKGAATAEADSRSNTTDEHQVRKIVHIYLRGINNTIAGTEQLNPVAAYDIPA